MADLSTLSYTSTWEISILSHDWGMKKVPLSGSASPYSNAPPPPPPPPSTAPEHSYTLYFKFKKIKKKKKKKNHI